MNLELENVGEILSAKLADQPELLKAIILELVIEERIADRQALADAEDELYGILGDLDPRVTAAA